MKISVTISLLQGMVILAIVIAMLVAVGFEASYIVLIWLGFLCFTVGTISSIAIGRLIAEPIVSKVQELEETIEALREPIGEAKTTVGNLVSVSKELSLASKRLTSNSEKNVNQGSTIAGSMEQMAVNINAMASGAEQASVSANEVANTTEEMATNIRAVSSEAEQASANAREVLAQQSK